MTEGQSTEPSVLDRLRTMILDGRWRAGDVLPGERALAAEISCSRASLREALRVLEAQGIIDSVPGGRSTIRHRARSAFGSVLELQLALGMHTNAELLQTRIALEMWSARQAAITRTDDQVQQFRRMLTRMEDPEIPVREFNHLDAELHYLLAECSGNQMILDLNRSLRTAIRQQMIDTYDALDDWWSATHDVRSEHRQIVAAIERRDSELAAALVRSHIMNFFREALTGPDTPTR